MPNISVRKSLSIMKMEYVKWVCDARMIMMVITFIFIQTCAVTPLLERSTKMHSPINIWEPFIAVGNSGVLILILPLVYICLMSDFPSMDGNTLFVMHRVGRFNWFVGQILFAIASFLSYLLAIVAFSVLPVITKGFLANGWSLVVTDFDHQFPDEAGGFASQLLPMNLYNQMPPYKAAIYTYLLLAGYMMLLVLLMLLFQVCKKKLVGFFVTGSIIAVGTALCAIKTSFMWLTPMAHSIVWLHFTEYFRSNVVEIWKSALYFGIGIVLLIVLCFLVLRKMNFESVGEGGEGN